MGDGERQPLLQNDDSTVYANNSGGFIPGMFEVLLCAKYKQWNIFDRNYKIHDL
jgi:hypothetical protein